MCLVGAPWIKGYFRVAGDVKCGADCHGWSGDPPDFRVRVIDHCEFASLNISVRRQMTAGPVAGLLVLVSFGTDSWRPADAAVFQIPNVAILAPGVAGDVFPPASRPFRHDAANRSPPRLPGRCNCPLDSRRTAGGQGTGLSSWKP